MFTEIKDAPKFEGKNIELRGWVHRHRASKKMVFIILRDHTGLIQCTIPSDAKFFEDTSKLLVESSIEIKGKVSKDERSPGGYEVKVSDLNIVHSAERFPITKDQSTEFLREQRHLWMRSQKMINAMKVRSTAFKAIHEYFDAQGFYETHSPIFTPTAGEKGSELFQVNYFGKKAFLSQTWQLYAEAIVMGLEKIYTIAPSFRAEKSRTTRHLTEFWQMEMEMTWADIDEIMKHAENCIAHVCKRILEENERELDYFKVDKKRLKKVVTPFPRITYSEAIKILKKENFPVIEGKDLRTNEEKVLTEKYDKPVFVTNYPKEIMAFYKPNDPKNPGTAKCFDLLVPGVGELIGGSERDLDVEAMKKHLKKDGEKVDNYKFYFDTRKYGSVPHAGWGMGMERLIQWILGLESIQDAIPFPRTMDRITP